MIRHTISCGVRLLFEDKMEYLINKIKSYTEGLSKLQKTAFISAVIAGIFAHGYGMANHYIYHDATILNGLGITYGIGRWVLGYAEALNKLVLGNYNLPFINIALSLLYIAVASMTVVRMLKVKKTFTAIFIGAIMTVHPTVQSSFAYNFTASYYAFALMLSVFAADLLVSALDSGKINIKNAVLSIVLLAVSLGTYQAYISVTACLLISSMIIDLFDENKGDETVKTTVIKGLRYVAGLGGALLIYLVVNKVTNLIVKPYIVSYQGGDDLGKLKLSIIPRNIINAYAHFFYIKWNGINVSKPMWGFVIGFLVLSAIVVILKLVKSQVKKDKKILIVLLFLIFPMAVNLVYLMSTSEYYAVHTLMRYGTAFVFILPLVLIENEKIVLKDVAEILVTALAVCYIFADNAAYTKMTLVQEEMTSFFTVLESRITSTEGYSDDLHVVFVGEGKIEDNNLTELSETYPNTKILGYEYNAGDLINKESWLRYMRIHAGFEPEVDELTEDIASSDEFYSMDTYPNANSVKVINGKVVVRFSDN